MLATSWWEHVIQIEHFVTRSHWELLCVLCMMQMQRVGIWRVHKEFINENGGMPASIILQ